MIRQHCRLFLPVLLPKKPATGATRRRAFDASGYIPKKSTAICYNERWAGWLQTILTIRDRRPVFFDCKRLAHYVGL